MTHQQDDTMAARLVKWVETRPTDQEYADSLNSGTVPSAEWRQWAVAMPEGCDFFSYLEGERRHTRLLDAIAKKAWCDTITGIMEAGNTALQGAVSDADAEYERQYRSMTNDEHEHIEEMFPAWRTVHARIDKIENNSERSSIRRRYVQAIMLTLERESVIAANRESIDCEKRYLKMRPAQHQTMEDVASGWKRLNRRIDRIEDASERMQARKECWDWAGERMRKKGDQVLAEIERERSGKGGFELVRYVAGVVIILILVSVVRSC